MGMNPLNPSLMTAPERLGKLCRLLALGIVRLRSRQSSHLLQPDGESSLHFTPDQSGHAAPLDRRTT